MGKVFIVEPSEEQREVIAAALGSAHELQFYRNVHTARDALAIRRPDALVLGLYDLDGLAFLQELGEDRPRVLVCTAACSHHTERHLLRLADSLMYIPCNLSLLADRVNDLVRSRFTPAEICEDDPAFDILRQLLPNPGRYGYRYILSAVKLYMCDPMQAVTKVAYPAIAKEYHTTAQCVEKAIRGAIKQAYLERDDALWRRFFHTDRTGEAICPSNKAFFVRMANHIKSQYRRRA